MNRYDFLCIYLVKYITWYKLKKCTYVSFFLLFFIRIFILLEYFLNYIFYNILYVKSVFIISILQFFYSNDNFLNSLLYLI